ncbi:MAG: hypothetical protein JWQ49_2469 [Edaphobacter sp.]|nr:hypothetical protein [Edaphobacter sp.]
MVQGVPVWFEREPQGSAAGVSCGRAGGELIGDPAATPFCCGVDMGEGALFTLAAALFMTRNALHFAVGFISSSKRGKVGLV